MSWRATLATVLFSITALSPLRSETPTNDRQRAAAALEQSVKADPGNSELWLHLGFAYRKEGNIDQAQTAFEKASQLNPHSTDAFYMLGLIYESKHQSAEAQKAWEAYLSQESDSSKRGVAEKHIHHLSQ